MNRITLIITFAFTLGLLFVEQAQAQRYLPGQKGIQLTGSFVDGFKMDSGDKQAFAGGIALSAYLKNENRWVFGAEYLQKKQAYKDILIPVSQFTAEAGYYLNFLSDRSKTVFLSAGVSAMAGYETVNWGKQLLFDGATITSKDNYLYGGAVTFEVETFLSDRFAVTLHARERILFGSSVRKYHFQTGLGVKVIIN